MYYSVQVITAKRHRAPKQYFIVEWNNETCSFEYQRTQITKKMIFFYTGARQINLYYCQSIADRLNWNMISFPELVKLNQDENIYNSENIFF